MTDRAPVGLRLRRAPGAVAALALLWGCGPTAPLSGEPGLHLRIAGPHACGVDRFEVVAVGTDDTPHGPVVHYIPPTDLVDGGTLDEADGLYAVAEHVVDLPPGHYDLSITAQRAAPDSGWEDVRRRPAQGAHVGRGGRGWHDERYDCDDHDSSATGLEVVLLVNEGPALVHFELTPSKFAPLCGTVDLAARFDDADGSDLEVTWQVFDGMGDDGHPDPATRIDDWTDPAPQRVGDTAARSTFTWSCQAPGTRYLVATGTDAEGAETAFWTMVHCYGFPADNVCREGDELAVAGTCQPGVAPPTLDPACLEAYLATEACPDPLAAPCTGAATWPTCQEVCDG